MVKKSTYYLTISVFILMLLALAGFQYFNQGKVIGKPIPGIESCPYHNINPLRCEPDLAKKKKEYVALKNELNEYIENEKNNKNVKSISVYFRDLQNGPIMSINGQENFTPASLLKLPIMISYFKKTENNPEFLQHKISVPENISSLSQNIKPGFTLEKGKAYTIDELINILITRSDNLSSSLLLANLGYDNFVFTLSDLGFIDPKKDSAKQFITVQNYASIFRILFNSSYLNPEMSDKALELLKKSEFLDGLVAGVPEGTEVAHKFGERKNGNEQQLHDCGIVYFPENPYILCVMTKGGEVVKLENIIREISGRVYKEVEGRN